jgi:hypothetical protein
MEAIMLEESTTKSTTNIGKDSKTVYINDSYNLDTIPLGCQPNHRYGW